jgi:hypothetical protein
MNGTTAGALVAAAVAALLVAAVAACNGSKGTPEGEPDGGEPDDGIVAAEAGEASDFYDAGFEPESGPSGYVFFAMNADGPGSLGAVFDGTPVAASRCRLTTTYGACAVYTCPSAGDADAGPTANAGTLTFAAPSLEAGVAVAADATGLYATATPDALFAPGDSLSVTASGGTVPAFGPQAVTAPGSIALTSPVTDGGAVDVPTGSDLGFAWTGGSVDSVAILTASGETADGSLVVARCSYVAITDEGVIPTQVLTAVKGLAQGTLGWAQANTATFDAGAWSITLLAGSYGSAPATFQ